jgi:anti-sigma factor RsiW
MPLDEMLVAFIDGELDPAESGKIEELIRTDKRVAERFDVLSSSNLPFRDAFESMLAAAPTAKLEAMLSSIPVARQREVRRAGMGRRGFLGAAAACLIAGIAVDRAAINIGHRIARPDEGSEWRAVVAEYLALYTSDTLSASPGDRAAQAAQLNDVGSRLGLALTPEAVALPGAEFRRAQTLEYDGKPLAQIAYLDSDGEPMALCIVPSDKPAAAPDTELRRGMNVVYWSNAGHAFMLIGHGSAERMMVLADSVRGRLTA